MGGPILSLKPLVTLVRGTRRAFAGLGARLLSTWSRAVLAITQTRLCALVTHTRWGFELRTLFQVLSALPAVTYQLWLVSRAYALSPSRETTDEDELGGLTTPPEEQHTIFQSRLLPTVVTVRRDTGAVIMSDGTMYPVIAWLKAGVACRPAVADHALFDHAPSGVTFSVQLGLYTHTFH